MSETPATKPPNIFDYVILVLLFMTVGMIIHTVENVSLTESQLAAEVEFRKIELSQSRLAYEENELAWRMTQ